MTSPFPTAAADLFRQGPPPRILVVGDLMLDRFVRGHANRLSPEAPVPVLSGVQVTELLGGAGNVAANLAALGARVALCATVGDDLAGARLRSLLAEIEVEAAAVVTVAGRPTTTKERLVAGHQQLLRIDGETRQPLAEAPLAAVDAALRAALAGGGHDAIVVSDYQKGLLGAALMAQVMAAARRHRLPVWVDPKGDDWGRFRGAVALTPNLAELAAATGRPLGADATPAAIHAAASLARARAGVQAVLVTCGARGILVCDGPAPPAAFIGAEAPAVFDVTGAGDTVIAGLAWASSLGLGLAAAAHLAAVAAALAVSRPGTTAVARADVARAWRAATARPAPAPARGVGALAAGEAQARSLAARAQGLRVVFTNGCFDLLHAGHLSLLEAARAEGDLLVVGLNTDASVAALKGPSRPVVGFADRAQLLAALRCVDLVVGFDAPTPLALIAAVRPHVLVKGADWRGREVVGADLVAGWGGRVMLAELVPGRSTTGLVARARGEVQPAA